MAAPSSNTVSAGEGGLVTPADLLVIILDTNPFAWHSSSLPSSTTSAAAQDEIGTGDDGNDKLTFDEAVQSVLVFCNAHMALRFENQVAIYSAGLGQSKLLYSSADPGSATTGREVMVDEDEDAGHPGNGASASSSSSSYQTFRIVDESIARGLRRLHDDELERGDGDAVDALLDRPVAFSGAISKALCHINRLSKAEQSMTTTAPLRARILVLSVSGETSSQYIPIMNCIFAAQKASIPIDVCKIYGEDAVFLQQASHLTKASYYRLERRSALLQYLLVAFLPGLEARRYLHLPRQEQIDLRAACFCHKRIVDIGYVCSICLSIFCSPVPVCKTCRTKFPVASLRSLMGAGGAALGGPSTAGGARKRKAVGTTAASPRVAANGSSSGTPPPPVVAQTNGSQLG